MAVVSVELKKQGMTGTREFETREYVEVYCVTTDDPTDKPDIIFAHASVPAIGETCAYDGTAFCTNVEVAQEDASRLAWLVTVTYTASNTITADNPLSRDPIYTWSSEERTRAFTVSKLGTVVVNTANDPFVPALETIERDLKLTIVRNESTFDAATLIGFINTTNSTSFTVAGYTPAIQECLIKEITGTSKSEDGTDYWEVTYELVFRKHDASWTTVANNAWKRRVLNVGLWELVGGVKKQIVVNGLPVEEPKLLTAAGAYETNPANAVWLGFAEYATANHSTLGL